MRCRKTRANRDEYDKEIIELLERGGVEGR